MRGNRPRPAIYDEPNTESRVKRRNRALTMIAVGAALLLSDGYARDRSEETSAILDGDPMYAVLPPGAIPAITDPEYVTGEEAVRQMSAHEPVLGILIGGKARAYSLWQLDAHEIVNDEIGGTPVAVTW